MYYFSILQSSKWMVNLDGCKIGAGDAIKATYNATLDSSTSYIYIPADIASAVLA